ncbi:hypothetical protein PUN28_003194 [Cardiocondyla obscurior]|uniref:Uncharacterized protein n=1 Tax=Cardiocondyla obscurior TaxID=286306 RepID=A0AAW2GJC9_9HYME
MKNRCHGTDICAERIILNATVADRGNSSPKVRRELLQSDWIANCYRNYNKFVARSLFSDILISYVTRLRSLRYLTAFVRRCD